MTLLVQGVFAQENSDSISKESSDSYKQSISFEGLSATEFFILLAKSDTVLVKGGITIFREAPENWVTEHDIEYLIEYIMSDQKRNCLKNAVSSYLVEGHTTLGGQAMDLIDSFRLKKKYFSAANSCTKTDNERADEILKWWVEFNKN